MNIVCFQVDTFYKKTSYWRRHSKRWSLSWFTQSWAEQVAYCVATSCHRGRWSVVQQLSSALLSSYITLTPIPREAPDSWHLNMQPMLFPPRGRYLIRLRQLLSRAGKTLHLLFLRRSSFFSIVRKKKSVPDKKQEQSHLPRRSRGSVVTCLTLKLRIYWFCLFETFLNVALLVNVDLFLWGGQGVFLCNISATRTSVWLADGMMHEWRRQI